MAETNDSENFILRPNTDIPSLVEITCACCAQSCLILCHPMDCSLPGSSVHGILQARILEWVAISYQRIFLTQGLKSPFSASPVLAGRCFVQFNSVPQLCPTLCDPTEHSTPGFTVHHKHLELAQTHVHRVGDDVQPSHPLSSPYPPAFNLSQHQGLFK